MTTYTWNPGSQGEFIDWNTALAWLPMIVPNSLDADVIVPGATEGGNDSYITINNTESIIVQSLTLDRTFILSGSLSIGSGFLMQSDSELDISGSLSIGSLSNVAQFTDIQGSGQISSPGSIDNQGKIIGFDGNLVLDFAGLRNDGELAAVSGGLTVDVGSAPGAFGNLSDGTLSVGTYEAGYNGVLDLNVGGGITADAAAIVLQLGGIIETDAADRLSATLRTITAAGSLTLEQTTFGAANSLAVSGRVDLDSATLSSSGLRIRPGATVIGGGTIAGPVTDNGSLTVNGSLMDSFGHLGLVIDGSVTGAGTIALQSPQGISGGSPTTLEVTGAVANAVAFSDWNGILVLDSPTLLTGTISGFAAGIDESDGGLGSVTH